MPGYVRKALTRFQHPPPAKRQDQPYPHVKPNYGVKKQYSQENDGSPALNKAGKKIIQEVCGVFLFLTRAVDGGTTPCPQLSRVPTGKPDGENNGTLQAVFIFHVNTGRRCTHLPSKRHGPCKPQRCVLVVPPQAQIPQLCQRPHAHGGKRRNPHQQRGSPQHLVNNPDRHVIHGGGRSGCLIHLCENSRFNATNANQTWKLTTAHSDANRQCNSTCTTHQPNSTK